eukprot:gene12049-8301_t
MSLGVRGATVFAQDSNHQTALNHSHRDTSGYDASKQTKSKCPNCGCWATKGKPCYQCHRNPDGTCEGEAPPVPEKKAPGASKPDNANQHKFREQSAYDPKAKLRCKCPSCGCWVTKGKTCKVATLYLVIRRIYDYIIVYSTVLCCCLSDNIIPIRLLKSVLFLIMFSYRMASMGARLVAQAGALSYYSARAMIDPTDGAAVAAVGELSAVNSLENMRRMMMESQTGRYILQVQPRVRDSLLEEARQMPKGSFGRRYADYMDYNNFTPEGRTPVKHISDNLLAYIMTRYRECHDFLHTCCDCGRTVHEEIALKLLEFQHTGLPLGVLALPGGFFHLNSQDARKSKVYWEWAKANAPCTVHGKPPVPFYLTHVWEDLLELPMEEVQKITGITPLPEYMKNIAHSGASRQSQQSFFLCWDFSLALRREAYAFITGLGYFKNRRHTPPPSLTSPYLLEMPKEKKEPVGKKDKRHRRDEVKIVDLVLQQPHTYELMQINPEITMNALTAIEESGQFEEFMKHAKTLGLKPGNLRGLNSVRELNEMIARVTNTIKIVASNSSTMGYFCEHLLRSTKKCQAFIRKALAKRKREKDFAKARWTTTQEKARKVLELVVKDRVKRLKSSQSQNVLEETWGVLIDCYISPEDMNAAIDSYFRETSLKYLLDFRQYRRKAKENAQTSSELYSTQRRKLREAILKYPGMCEVVCLTPQVTELCVHLDHIHNFEGITMMGGEESEAAEMRKKKKGHVFAPTPTVNPVSYYHALITLSPREDFPLLLALRALNSGADPKTLNRINGPSRQVIQRACNLKQKWNVMHGKPSLTAAKVGPGEVSKVDENGQPKSCIDCGPCVRRKERDAGGMTMNPRRLMKSPSPAKAESQPQASGRNSPSAASPNPSLGRLFSAEPKPRIGAIFNESSPSGRRNSGRPPTSTSVAQTGSSGNKVNAMWEVALQNHSARVLEHRRSRVGSVRLPEIQNPGAQ